jgi:hypothetical protein
MIRFLVPIYVLVTAVMAAIMVDITVHFGFGIASSTIRTDALVGIIFVGVVLAGSTLLKRNK